MPPAALAIQTGRPTDSIDQEAQIELLFDVETFLDEELAYFFTLGTGLGSDELLAQNVAGMGFDFIHGLGQFDSAGFSSPTGVDLGFHDHG